VRLLWSQPLVAPPRGLALAREPGWGLVWDAQHQLSLYNQKGFLQAQRSTAAPCTAIGIADDGGCAAAGGELGQLWRLAPDLSTVWQRVLPYRVTAVALSALGDYLAATDASGGLHLFDRHGQVLWKAATPRALYYLTFIPECPCLMGAADFGLVACFDAAGRALWQEGLVSHVGSLAVSTQGRQILLACFTEGLVRYTLAGSRLPQPGQIFPSRLAALSYDGTLILTADLDKGLTLATPEGTVKDRFNLESPPVDLALGPLGDYLVVITEMHLLALAVE